MNGRICPTSPPALGSERQFLKGRLPSGVAQLYTCVFIVLGAVSPSYSQDAGGSKDLLASLAGVTEGDLPADVLSSVQTVSKWPSSKITDVLAAMTDATPRGKNWLRAVATDVADNGEFAQQDVMDFFADRSNDKDARYVAYLLLADRGEEPSKLLATAESDPSLPVRYLKIERLLQDAQKAESEERKTEAIELFRKIVEFGRSPSQLKSAAESLRELGAEVDLAASLGLILDWQIIGPFDNTDMEHFDTPYSPEQQYLSDGNPVNDGEEKGKEGPVKWQKVSSESEMGLVDLNAPLDNVKDAASYAFTTIKIKDSDAGKAVVRLGCITASKVWVNGKLAMQNNVYHSGTRIDQYLGDCELAAGENTIFVKVLQNAQTEPWAQDYQFQLRLTNPAGDAVRPLN